MDYSKLEKRIDDMLEYESDNYLVNINLKEDINDKLLVYQHLHVFNLMTTLRSSNVVLDGSDTGTGKTYTTVAICKQLRLKPFIICPKSITSNWKRVCKYFNVTPLCIVNYETIKNGKQYDSNGERIECKFLKLDEEDYHGTYHKYITQSKPRNLSKDKSKKSLKGGPKNPYRWFLPKYSVIIFDEVHKCKNKNSLNGKLLLAAKHGEHKVIMLSATIADTPKSFHVFGYMLDFYNNLRSAKGWIDGMIREDNSYIGIDKKMNSVNKCIFPFKGSRMMISDIGDKFPKNQICADCYDIDSSITKEVDLAYNTIIKNKYTNKGTDALNELMFYRQKLELIKIPIIQNLANEYIDNGYNVAIFVNFNKTLKELSKLFKTSCVINGNQSDQDRQNNINGFQSNKENIIICNIKAGGVGIDLHDLHGIPRVSIISPSYSSIELMQALGRIYRAGAKTPALQRIIYCSNTCEEKICARVQEKLNFMAKINDDDLIKI